jgi:hypothetical protein
MVLFIETLSQEFRVITSFFPNTICKEMFVSKIMKSNVVNTSIDSRGKRKDFHELLSTFQRSYSNFLFIF